MAPKPAATQRGWARPKGTLLTAPVLESTRTRNTRSVVLLSTTVHRAPSAATTDRIGMAPRSNRVMTGGGGEGEGGVRLVGVVVTAPKGPTRTSTTAPTVKARAAPAMAQSHERLTTPSPLTPSYGTRRGRGRNGPVTCQFELDCLSFARGNPYWPCPRAPPDEQGEPHAVVDLGPDHGCPGP